MAKPVSDIDAEVLAEALRDVVGVAAEQPLREGSQSVSRLVRRLLGNPRSARKLVDAVTARAIERREEKELPLEFGPVVTDSGTYDNPPVMLDPMGSPEFDAAIDALLRFDD